MNSRDMNQPSEKKVTFYKVAFCILPWHKLILIFGHQIPSIISLSIPLKYSKLKNKSNRVHNNSHIHKMGFFSLPSGLSPFS